MNDSNKISANSDKTEDESTQTDLGPEAQLDLGYGHMDWTRGPGRLRRIRDEQVALEALDAKAARKVAARERKIAYARRYPRDHRAAQAAKRAEAGLVVLADERAALHEKRLSLRHEALAIHADRGER